MSEKWNKCPDDSCGGPIITCKKEVIYDHVGHKKVIQRQYCNWCKMEQELEVEQYCPCCDTYLGE